MLHIKKSIYKLLLLFLVGFILIIEPESLRAAAANKDVILVLDTSLSMVGYQGKNILESVKGSVNSYIDSLQDGDRVTFVTFDERVKVFPQVLLDDQNDRDIVKKYISTTEAKGQWTYTLEMLKTVFALADQLTKESAQNNTELKRNVVIVIMSDGLDDPPPSKVKEKFDLKKVAAQYSGNDWWIYLVNLDELQKSKEISAAQKNLLSELNKVSGNTNMLDGSNPDQAINDELRKDVESKEKEQFYRLLTIVAGLLILILLIVLIVIKIRSVKITGHLEHWNHELLKPEVLSLSLTNLDKKEIILGRTNTCTVKIREYESRIPFTIKAVKKGGQVLLKVNYEAGLDFGFKNREADGYLVDGDIFSASNISFRYIAD
ncbi:MAG TPA: VWA domain-containing protein [Spirochaetota bacterium]|nr:VWA domain-containing protein [Spirochaetota bacterium]